MCTRQRLSALMREFYSRMRDLFGEHLREVILFGSYARSEEEEGSDMDVLVPVDLPREALVSCRAAIADAAAEFLFTDEILLSPIVENADFFASHIGILPFYRNIDREGVRIVA